jgi:3-hydroxybutyryl-CoA dehydrogenase
MRYVIHKTGSSRSFPDDDVFLSSQAGGGAAEIAIYSGTSPKPDPRKAAILIELGHECLSEHVREEEPAYANMLGFARYRNGDDPPSRLVELVRHSNSSTSAVAAARQLFEVAGLEVVVCGDQVGRIISRLVVPKYNAALRFLDEGLASQADMDLTCRLGLGYPDGPIERVTRGGLVNHYNISKALFDAYGTPAYAPPRRSAVALKHASRASEWSNRRKS